MTLRAAHPEAPASFYRAGFGGLAKALVRHPTLLVRLLRVQKNIFVWYFLPQFIPGRVRKVVVLDSEADTLITFNPGYFPCYLEFIHLWMGSLGWVYGKFGVRALPEMLAYLDGLESLFNNARRIFEVCGSTITRPGPRLNVASLLIHLSDRNQYCFPSMHVMLVCYNFEKIAEIVGRLSPEGEDHFGLKKLLEERALRIVESIIYVKQHGLIDIPAALFLSTASGTGLGRSRDLDFLSQLFINAEDMAQVDRERLSAFFKKAYIRMWDAWNEKRDPASILVEILQGYPEEMKTLVPS